MKQILYIMITLIAYSCVSEERKIITYKQLPLDVRDRFQKIYNYYEPPKVNIDGDTIMYMPPFSECYSLNENCKCEITSNGGLIRSPFFVIKSCDREIKVSWEVLERVFIIKNDSIYYPYHIQKAKYKDVNNGEEFEHIVGGTITTDKPRSFNIKIDTLNFAVQKMKE